MNTLLVLCQCFLMRALFEFLFSSMCRIMDRSQWNMSLIFFDGNHKLWLQSSNDLEHFQSTEWNSFCARLCCTSHLWVFFFFPLKMQYIDSYTFYINEIYIQAFHLAMQLCKRKCEYFIHGTHTSLMKSLFP